MLLFDACLCGEELFGRERMISKVKVEVRGCPSFLIY